MFISFSKVLGKVGGFHIGFRKKITSKNLLWISLLYCFVAICQLLWYTAILMGWLLYAFCYGIAWVTKKLFTDFSERFGKLKATIIIAVIYSVVILIFVMLSSASKPATDPIVATEAIETTATESAVSIELIAGEPGEYGDLFTMNEGTEFEETYHVYRIPAGTYTVTNTGAYLQQISVYSDEISVTEEGWEEPAETFYNKALNVGQSDTFTIADGQHIEIHKPAEFTLELVG